MDFVWQIFVNIFADMKPPYFTIHGLFFIFGQRPKGRTEGGTPCGAGEHYLSFMGHDAQGNDAPIAQPVFSIDGIDSLKYFKPGLNSFLSVDARVNNPPFPESAIK
ncbi:MAG: hypothetical protein A3I06_14310 [Candidatus Lindowbacteria bacterium RIFCSPLOWO2_02_FULL_62_12]|nr:MAG: hypothetical protein A3I06_14310 [Candidatus Lindowbacteria bacterium RIFCSPLOWO2_02_FULL_62_12]